MGDVYDIKFTTKRGIRQSGFARFADIKSGDLEPPSLEEVSHLPIAASPVEEMSSWYLLSNVIGNSNVSPNTNWLVKVKKMVES